MEQPQQQEEYSGSQYGNVEPSDSFLKAMIEVEESLQKFEMESLRRKRIFVDVEKKKKTWKPMAEGVPPMCNDLGIAEILGFMRGRVTVIARLTKKNDEEIMRDMFQFHNALNDLVSLRADDWDLNEELTKPLIESVLALVEDIVFSARGGFTAMNVKSQYTRHEATTSSGDQEQSGGSILGWRVPK